MNETKKKILFVITKSNWGGAQRYVYDIATSLDKSLFEVHVALGGNGLLKEKLEEAGIATTTLETLQRDVNIKKEFKSAKELFRLYRNLRPDIVHLNSSKAGGLGAFVARIAFVPRIIFTAHAWAFNENRNLFSKLTIGFLHWITVILAHRTIAVSQSVKEQVLHMPFMKNRIEVIHLGLEPFQCFERDEARKALGTHGPEQDESINNEIWVGTISELHPVKGIPYAIDAIALLKDQYPALHFYIIGEGEQRDLIEKQITKRKLHDKVHLNGFIDDARTFLKAFDIFILPSLSEAFGYSLIEAGFAGVPVIATKVGGIPEVVEEAGILVPSRNGKAIADAIVHYLSEPNERAGKSSKLHERVITHFTVDRMLIETIDVYQNTR